MTTEFAPKCPTCDLQITNASDAANKPFCSHRCRMIDLGRWLNEEHALPCESDEEEDSEHGTVVDASTTSNRGKPVRLPPGWHDA